MSPIVFASGPSAPDADPSVPLGGFDPAKTALNRLGILALDCQSTGATPQRGSLLEIGWITGCAAAPHIGAGLSFLIRQTRDRPIPASVSRITGICEADLRHAVSEEAVWRELIRGARLPFPQGSSCLRPLVIHYARFELPFLHRLHAMEHSGAPFPFKIICTHAIARRLLPDLPRRGLRALAGYFGHCVPVLKRCAEHALATLSIWGNLVLLLQSRCGVHTLEGLEEWLAAAPLPGKAERRYPLAAAERRALPDGPGIYRMRRSDGGVLYIGKAKSLRKRVNSYFRSGARHPEHILEMLTQARALDAAATASALEAAVLEADEIKRHCPPYNIALRTDRRSLVYCTRDLQGTSPCCTGEFCAGPVPSGRWIGALAAVAECLPRNLRESPERLEAIGHALLGFSPARPVDPAIVQEGLDLFRSTHRERLQNSSPLRAVTSLGAHIRRRLLQPSQCPSGAGNAAEADEDLLPDPKTDALPVRPSEVAGAIENLLVRTAQLLRRGRWLNLLSDCCLLWACSDDPRTLKHLLVFENGNIVERGQLRPGGKPPAGPHGRRLRKENRRSMELAAYDRLRVVTTELRRLVCDGRAIELRFSPRSSLGACELKKALRWV